MGQHLCRRHVPMKGKSSSWGKKVLPKGFSPKHFYLTANEKFFHQTEKNNKRREGKKCKHFLKSRASVSSSAVPSARRWKDSEIFKVSKYKSHCFSRFLNVSFCPERLADCHASLTSRICYFHLNKESNLSFIRSVTSSTIERIFNPLISLRRKNYLTPSLYSSSLTLGLRRKEPPMFSSSELRERRIMAAQLMTRWILFRRLDGGSMWLTEQSQFKKEKPLSSNCQESLTGTNQSER